MLLRLLVICLCAGTIGSQQQYIGSSLPGCENNQTAIANRLYLNDGQGKSCRGYLIFKSRKLYNSVQSISALMSVNSSDLAGVNNVTLVGTFEINKEVIVPVKCFSFGRYYQANTTYTIPEEKSTYFVVAKEIYQGLATCDAVRLMNPYGELDLLGGMVLQVPMRCACPTANQNSQGVTYLLTYSISWQDTVPEIGKRFHITREILRDANELSVDDIFPFTTLLIPLKDEPLSSWAVVQNKTQAGSPPDESGKGSKISKLYIGVGIAVGSSLAVCFAFTCVAALLHKKSALDSFHGNEDDRDSELIVPKEIRSEITSYDHQSFRVFKYEELKHATENFSSNNLIKGSAYLGEIKGRTVTIKRMVTDVSKEVNMLKKINHFSLTQLYGICVDRGCSYLVYEYLENGSLLEWLRDEKSPESGSWARRIQIALDVANGLHYLHNFIEPAYVHKDITSSNILLNEDLRAKISNFKQGKAADKGTRHVSSTANIIGTRGYMAPEYLSQGEVTTKLDVYAFGVVLLELLTGKDALITTLDNKEASLKEEVITLMEGDNAEAEVSNLIDPRLKGDTIFLFAGRAMKLSAACVMNDPASRPCIGQVVSSLQNLQADMEKSQVHVS